ncbi:MAG: SRPBCC family protein [Planctomycetaceae bacterium]
MYHSSTSLEPLMTPDDYCSADVYERERRAIFGQSWHPVGVASSIRNSGDHLTFDVMGVPVLVRNFDGQLVALRNVCAHRQCTLVSAATGRSERLKCPYHGWEFGADGRTRRIPAATNFPQFDRETYRLDRFPLEQCGDLIFIRLDEHGPSLSEWMGDYFERFTEWFSAPRFAISLSRRIDYPANWKIPVEASLESYHIPEVHPLTFGEDPAEDGSEHFFTDNGSSFHARLATPRFIDRALRIWERALLGFLGIESLGQYQHYHVYPNLLVSYTDSLSLVHYVMPTGPTTSVGCGWHFGRRPDRPGRITNVVAAAWGKFTGSLSFQVLNEDLVMYPKIQAGAAAASRPGLLGRCEERLHSFQKFVHQQMLRSQESDCHRHDFATEQAVSHD